MWILSGVFTIAPFDCDQDECFNHLSITFILGLGMENFFFKEVQEHKLADKLHAAEAVQGNIDVGSGNIDVGSTH